MTPQELKNSVLQLALQGKLGSGARRKAPAKNCICGYRKRNRLLSYQDGQDKNAEKRRND